MKRFYLKRETDISGVSGIGNVLEGCQFDNGRVAATWLSNKPCLSFYDNIETIIEIHGHDGMTTLVWIDEESANVVVRNDCVIRAAVQSR
jgi:hypothetical protein